MVTEIQSKNLDDISFKEAGIYENTRFEKIHNVVYDNSGDASILIAQEIASIIKLKQKENTNCILGLATGSSPIKVYEELIRLHKTQGLSFKNVITFNLDEYYPIAKSDLQSYFHFMHEYLFKHIDILPENINIPHGDISPDNILETCIAYENKIKEHGGLDFQLLGIGRTGHIGFNEPGSHSNSRTRLITLDHITKTDAAPAFLGLENVPTRAITMGIRTVMEAKRIILMAWGENKAEVIKKTVEGEISSQVPATYLQHHKNTTFVIDKGAASLLTQYNTPWLVRSFDWSEELMAKAILWLCEVTSKSILRLTDKDYNDHGMESLLAKEGNAYTLNIKMFNRLQHTITGWPGGKPNADDTSRPEREIPKKKRVIVFSPHPDDDVISMGGTIDRLVEQGHEVHIAYQTSGNIAVSNREALKFAEVSLAMGVRDDNFRNITQIIKQSNTGEFNTPELLTLKGVIRQKESLGATRYLGIPDGQVHFLNMPFYETGRAKKNALGEKDVQIVCDLIAKIKPHQIYAAGDLADPHGTHKVCLDALFIAIEKMKTNTFMKDCWVWLYRGAWHEWGIHEIDMAVPMSPDQVIKKRKAIFFHQSQKDGVMFQGDDAREFWVRAEERNKDTALKYSQLGLADYAAIEAFKRYDF
ncbi:glucosamine-6-phosphate deaminase [Aquimarina sp. AU474]|uniref:glucosamine-6-phosphate deaminase n=1 Tax=Aquimarina sp. AU474 TaxID=2108529 RepID=UPI000D68994C|nr:glucosamine-6-phosphate deaminase [Aquimarina sp. AU474]